MTPQCLRKLKTGTQGLKGGIRFKNGLSKLKGGTLKAGLYI